ncbi:MAG: cytochrome c oxidase assembly protein [Gammaproteobacteria bacterium]|nr:cytochrome c oxidase assembly protein [Gammaproteobacteria bacterium]
MAGGDLEKRHARTVGKLVLVVIAMFGFGFAMVPMYSAVCAAFGLNGKTERISSEDGDRYVVDEDRVVAVSFDATAHPRLPWSFEPAVDRVRVHPGERKRVMFVVRNLSGSSITGQAVHSVTPSAAAPHFKKTECFCFSQQSLAPGERQEMPVVFVVDPDLPEQVSSVTLSYTFLRADKYAGAN